MKEAIREEGGMWDVTPGKCVSKKVGRVVGEAERVVKCEEGRKRVHVKEPSFKDSCQFEYGWKGWGTYRAGDGDEHEFLAWPDMQMVRRDSKTRVEIFSSQNVFGGNLELAP